MSKMVREQQASLLRLVGEWLVQFGFGARPRNQTFYRVVEHGSDAVHLAFFEAGGCFDVTVDVATRFDAVEEIVSRFSPWMGAGGKTKTFTIGAELGHVLRRRQWSWTVCDENDVHGVGGSVMAMVARVGLPFLEEYSNAEHAYELTTRDDLEANLFCPTPLGRAQRACAFLVAEGRCAELSQLGERKLRHLVEIGDPSQEVFARFLAVLLDEYVTE